MIMMRVIMLRVITRVMMIVGDTDEGDDIEGDDIFVFFLSGNTYYNDIMSNICNVGHICIVSPQNHFLTPWKHFYTLSRQFGHFRFLTGNTYCNVGHSQCRTHLHFVTSKSPHNTKEILSNTFPLNRTLSFFCREIPTTMSDICNVGYLSDSYLPGRTSCMSDKWHVGQVACRTSGSTPKFT